MIKTLPCILRNIKNIANNGQHIFNKKGSLTVNFLFSHIDDIRTRISSLLRNPQRRLIKQLNTFLDIIHFCKLKWIMADTFFTSNENHAIVTDI